MFTNISRAFIAAILHALLAFNLLLCDLTCWTEESKAESSPVERIILQDLLAEIRNPDISNKIKI